MRGSFSPLKAVRRLAHKILDLDHSSELTSGAAEHHLTTSCGSPWRTPDPAHIFQVHGDLGKNAAAVFTLLYNLILTFRWPVALRVGDLRGRKDDLHEHWACTICGCIYKIENILLIHKGSTHERSFPTCNSAEWRLIFQRRGEQLIWSKTVYEGFETDEFFVSRYSNIPPIFTQWYHQNLHVASRQGQKTRSISFRLDILGQKTIWKTAYLSAPQFQLDETRNVPPKKNRRLRQYHAMAVAMCYTRLSKPDVNGNPDL